MASDSSQICHPSFLILPPQLWHVSADFSFHCNLSLCALTALHPLFYTAAHPSKTGVLPFIIFMKTVFYSMLDPYHVKGFMLLPAHYLPIHGTILGRKAHCSLQWLKEMNVFHQIGQPGSSDAGVACGGSFAALKHSRWLCMREDCRQWEGKGKSTSPVGAGGGEGEEAGWARMDTSHTRMPICERQLGKHRVQSHTRNN